MFIYYWRRDPMYGYKAFQVSLIMFKYLKPVFCKLLFSFGQTALYKWNLELDMDLVCLRPCHSRFQAC